MDRGVARAYVSLPETGKWSESVPGLDLDVKVATIQQRSAVLVKDALYFLFTYYFFFFARKSTVHQPRNCPENKEITTRSL